MRRSPLRRKKPLRKLGRWGKQARLHKAWADAVKRRDKCCQFPGCCRGDLEAHHVHPKGRYPDLRYHLANGIALCTLHHTGSEGWHSNARLWMSWWVKKFPRRWAILKKAVDSRRVLRHIESVAGIGPAD